MKDPFREHRKNGGHFIFKNENEFRELASLLDHFKYKMAGSKILVSEYPVDYTKVDSITLWCDGAAIGKYNPNCMGVYAVTFEEYHKWYLELFN